VVVVAPGRVVVVDPPTVVLLRDAVVGVPPAAALVVDVLLAATPAPTWICRGLSSPEKSDVNRKTRANAPRRYRRALTR
jgi:hypothetical protein